MLRRKGTSGVGLNLSTLSGMKRVQIKVPELVGQWTGPVSSTKYVVPSINKIILMHRDDLSALIDIHGKSKLPIV